MADQIRLSVITADGVIFEKNVSYVSVPTEFGSVGVLTGHAPMLCAVKKGIVKCRFGAEETLRLSVSDGIADVKGKEVTLLVSRAELIEQ